MIYIFACISQLTAQQPSNDTLTFEKAIKVYKDLLKKNPNAFTVAYNLAYAEYMKGNYNAVLKLCNQYEKKTSFIQADFYILHAVSLDRLHRTVDAMAITEDAIKTFPDKSNVWYQNAFYCYKYRKFDKAITSLSRSIALQPLNPQSHYLLSAILYENSNHPTCLLPLFYGMMTETEIIAVKPLLAYSEAILKFRHEDIQTPSPDMRTVIFSPEQIFQYYEPERLTSDFFKDWQSASFVSHANEYLMSNCRTLSTDSLSLIDNFYIPFYKKLIESGNSEAALYYMLRNTQQPSVNYWIKSSSPALDKLATWFDRNLPGK